MSPEPTEVNLSDGVVSFDGRVVEAFGFLWERPYRIHVRQITKIDFDGKKLRIRGIPKPVDLRLDLVGDDEAASADLGSLVNDIRAATPNLEQG